MISYPRTPRSSCRHFLPVKIIPGDDATLHELGWKREWLGGDDPDVEEEDVIEVLTHEYVRVSLQGA